LLLVEEDARASFGDHGKGEFELLAAVTAERVEDVPGKALGVDPDDRRCGVNVAHHEGDGAFDTLYGGWKGVVAGFRGINDALKAEDSELSPTSGEVGVGYLVDCSKGHLLLIIRLGAHRH